MSNVAFVGLGVMGYPMAGHLSNAGHNVSVYNRTTSKAEAWSTDYNGVVCNTPAEASQGAEFVFTCLGNDEDVRSVVSSENGVLAGMQENALLIDHTTASPELAQELKEKAA